MVVYAEKVILLNFCITDPPSPPQIHGDLRSEQRSGDKVKLTCITEGGNPLPKLSWLRNGLLLEERTLLEGNLLIFNHELPFLHTWVEKLAPDR